MTKRRNPERPRQEPPPAKSGLDAMGLATLAGVVVILMISFSNLRAIDRIQSGLESRLGQIDSKISQINAAPAQPAADTPPRRTGPDPERVYPIKTVGAPAKGPATAPVTIAEFSDFQ